MVTAADGLWAVTTYFNPVGYRRRRANYRLFRRHLPLPLLAVELSFGAEFELGEGDGDVVIQLRDGDVMWQKERLLNLAVAALPPACRKVVWMDCDVMVGREDWPERVSRALDEAPLVQPFSHVYHLSPGDEARPRIPGKTDSWQTSVPFAVAAGRPLESCVRRPPARSHGTCTRGVLWAARRELLAEHGLYDACVMGGGDSAMACAAYGHLDEVIRDHAMNEREEGHYRAWAEPFAAAVRGTVGFVETEIFHLWHGAMHNRRYRDRHEGLRRFQFDPSCDVAVGGSGCWRWNTDKPAMHQYVRDYFAARDEDADAGDGGPNLPAPPRSAIRGPTGQSG